MQERESYVLTDEEAANALMENAKDFLNSGLSLLLPSRLDRRNVKLSVVSLQTAVELLVKHRLVMKEGLAAIVTGVKPENAIDLANMRTITFSAALTAIQDHQSIAEWELEMLGEMATVRNRLVHFTFDMAPKRLKAHCLSLVCSALAMFAKGDARDEGEMVDYRSFLSEDAFNTLTHDVEYRAEAIDAAYASEEAREVKHCYLCKCESLSLRYSDVYFCHCCGFTLEQEVISFADCASCRAEDGVYYDRLNMTGASHFGKCRVCEIRQWVNVCSVCERKQSTFEPQDVTRCDCRSVDSTVKPVIHGCRVP